MPAENVGHAEVSVDLDADKIPSQARDAGQEAGEEFAEEFTRDAQGRLRDARGKFVKDGEAIGAAVASGAKRASSKSNPFSGLEAQFELSQSRILASVARFGPLIAAGLGAAVAIGPALATALPAVAALGAAVAVMVAGWDELNKSLAVFDRHWRRITPAISDALNEGVRPLVHELADRLFPVLETGLVDVAGSLNNVIKGFVDWAGQVDTLTRLEDLLTGVAPGLESLGAAAILMSDAFLSIATAAVPSFNRISDAVAGAAGSFAEWTESMLESGQLAGEISDSVDQLGSVLSDLGRIVGSALRLFDDLGPAGVAAFSGLADVVVGVLDGLRPLAQLLSANAAAVEQWAVGIGAAVVALQGLKLAALAMTRALAINPFIAAAAAIVGLAAASEDFRNTLQPLVDAFTSLPGPIQAAAAAMGIFALAMSQAQSGQTGLAGFSSRLGTMSTRMKLAGGGLAGLATGLLAFSQQAGDSNKTAGILAQTLGAGAGGAALGSVFGPLGIAVGGAAGSLLGLAHALNEAGKGTGPFADNFRAVMQVARDQARQAAAEIRDLREALFGFIRDAAQADKAGRPWLRTLNETTGAITRQTRSLAVNQIRQTGLVPVTKRLGLTMKELVSAGVRPSNREFIQLRGTLDRAVQQGRLTGTEYNRLVGVLQRMRTGLAGARDQHARLTGEQARGNTLLRQFSNSAGLTTGQLSRMTQAASGNRHAMELLSHVTGLSVADLRDLARSLEDVGRQKPRPRVELEGDEEARSGAEGVKAAIESIPTQWTVTITEVLQRVTTPGGDIMGLERGAMTGAIVNRPTVLLTGEQNRTEAIVPVTMPKRAMQIMEQSGAANIVRSHDDKGKQTVAPPNYIGAQELHVHVPTDDPETVAHQVANRIVSRIVR